VKPFWTARWWQVLEQIREDLQAAILRGVLTRTIDPSRSIDSINWFSLVYRSL